ncbi:hypothetical protein Phi19:1_gp107 [Cellulophaga phage phi19:1]|uniref:Uncharacterized protein n=1 Tax=Cellulophaga phage phi19:1 TaxID=1327970 RepID=R9ZYJ1_9CAUD|nr:hypothetical protein Phi19:1_gp107 [Cellulophaga phage phi19:1]AGO47397.1 hypothetical protein Phi19:1_gp107 [Cellulophaga phage phi19:1]
MFKEGGESGVLEFIIKTILPSLAGVCIGVAVKVKKSKVTILSAIMSLVIGVLTACVCSDLVHESFSKKTASLIIAIIAIISEKVFHWLIFDFDFTPIGNIIVERIKKFFR